MEYKIYNPISNENLEKVIKNKIALKIVENYQNFRSRKRKLLIFNTLIALLILVIAAINKQLEYTGFTLWGVEFIFFVLLSILTFKLFHTRLKLQPEGFSVINFPVLLYPYKNRTFVLSGKLYDTFKFELSLNEKTPSLINKIKKTETMIENSDFPAIKPHEPVYNVSGTELIGKEGTLIKIFEEILNDSKSDFELKTFELPLMRNPQLLNLLTTGSVSKFAEANVHDNESISSEKQLLRETKAMFDYIDEYYVSSLNLIEDILRTWEMLKSYLSDYLKVRENSIEFLGNFYSKLQDTFAMNSYGFYCPICAREKIYSEVYFNIDTGKWECNICKNNFELEELIVINKIKRNLLHQVFDKLMIEKENEINSIERQYQSEMNTLSMHYESEERQVNMHFKKEIAEEKRLIRQIKSEIKYTETSFKALHLTLIKHKNFLQDKLAEYQRDASAIKEQALKAAEAAANFIRKSAQRELESAVAFSRQLYEKEKIEERKRFEDIANKLEDIREHTGDSAEYNKVLAKSTQRQYFKEAAYEERMKALRSFLPAKIIHNMKARSYEKKSRNITQYIIKAKL